jgi:hypothetical protein
MASTHRKVAVTVSMEVDIEAWADANGLTSSTEVRDDVKAYVQTLVQECSASNEGWISEVKVK